MLELYFKYPKVLWRLRSGALGEEMDRIAARFADAGYKHESAKVYISRLGRFSDFATAIAGTAIIEQTVVERFLNSFRTATPRIAARTAIEHALRVAPERFSLPHRTMLDPHGPLLDAYLEHLRQVRGLEPKTCEGLLLAARWILLWYHERVPDQPLAAMTGEHVLSLIEHLLSRSANHYKRSAITSNTRTFLRFLPWSDLIAQDLARFVPRTLAGGWRTCRRGSPGKMSGARSTRSR